MGKDENDIKQKLSEIVSGSMQAAIMTATMENRSLVTAVQIALAGSVAAIYTMAPCVGDNEAGKRGDPPSSIAVLFSALLVHAATCHSEKMADGVEVDFSPMSIYEALVNCEKILGKRPDAYLNSNMCEAARKQIEEGAVPLEKLLQARSATFQSKTLN